MSTPYDEESVDLLEELNVPAFKIASTDANNLPFLDYVAKKGRPILLSTGMCDFAEVKESVDHIKEVGCKDVLVFHCTSSYPAPIEDLNLNVLPILRDQLNVLVGYSDHHPSPVCASSAVALGAVAYEKHFTLDKNLPGPDHRASLEPKELCDLVNIIRQTGLALGMGIKIVTPSEVENRDKLRKSIVAKYDLPAGTFLSHESLVIKRPGIGLPPSRYWNLLGKKTKHLIKQDSLLRESDLDL